MDDLLSELPPIGGVVDLQPLFFRLTLDITTAFLFGESIHSLRATDNSQEQTFAAAFDLAQKYVIKRYRLLDLYWLIGGSEFGDACRKVHEFADQVIVQKLSESTSSDDPTDKRYVFLKSVAQACPDRTALRGQIINILAAGRDATACLLSWTFFLLVRHPEAMDKVRREISQLEDGPLNRTHLRNLHYLRNVLKDASLVSFGAGEHQDGGGEYYSPSGWWTRREIRSLDTERFTRGF
ncbi:hypothetical protein J3459_007755 [Metarhizium acridum]|nr:hypothetical protein J3459_007755 [Metarhizium acridum]